ncbi:MAG TPA: FkbM family methyltransferase [Stellaceae bacterium]|jgi:FkbM family methyltransferase|nr:FkbM family methyltransferase [Stellaceae bacterium]
MDRSYSETLVALGQKGVRYATVIDLGCADGHFFVDHFLQGLFQESVPVNIDANGIYEKSLRQIAETFDGHYRIAAASDSPGDIELTTSIHPYWGSLRPRDDLYWERINNLASGAQRVPALRIDDLAAELHLKPPFLLKLDVQGAEVQALRGARRVLAETDVVICEADIADFQATNAEIVGAGFDLYDITVVQRLSDETLGWFYPVYLSQRLVHLRPRRFWQDASNETAIQQQIARRQQILARLANVLPQIRAARAGRKPG